MPIEVKGGDIGIRDGVKDISVNMGNTKTPGIETVKQSIIKNTGFRLDCKLVY